MIHGIRTVHLATFVGMRCFSWPVKAKPHDPAQLTAMDSMLLPVDAALLTLERTAIEVPLYVAAIQLFRDQQGPLSRT